MVAQHEGGPTFIMYEGPPTANGVPGIHHVLARVFKDIIPRYKTMQGFHTPRKAGWDTHGLPVELEVEKTLGISSKREIEEYGIERFNQLCRESVFKYVSEWERMTSRIGFWIDLDTAYATLTNDYIETGWWILKQLWDKNLVARNAHWRSAHALAGDIQHGEAAFEHWLRERERWLLRSVLRR